MTRATRTILFTDVVGSTELRTTKGDDAGDDAIATHDRAARESVESHGGTIVKGTGDGCLAVFPSARAAVLAAVDIQSAMSRLPAGAPQVRIGINAGEVRDVGDDVLGEAVNAAARIAALAGNGEILVSRVVRDLLGTIQGLALSNQGEVELKGFPTPWELFRVNATAAAEARLEIRLLGEVAMTVDGEHVPAFAAPRLQQLLARLVLSAGTQQSRARLAFELWPDSDEQQARTNLRKLLHELRASLPDADRFLDADSHSVRWRPGSGAAVDVVTFLDALRDGDLETAAAAYGGDLLPGCYDDWLLDERERLRASALDALGRLATDAVERGDNDTTIRCARRVVRLDPLNEPSYRLLMQALARRGERAEALRAYHRCVEALRRDLGVDPEATTQEVYEAVRRGPLATEALPVSAPVTDLVGRDDEFAVASGVWARAVSGQASVLLVTGEAGIGKSRLVEEVARRAAAQGHGVARTRAYEAAGRFAWGPAVELLRSETVRPTLARLESVWLAELARLLPELRDERPDLPEPPILHDEAHRQRLFEAVARGLLAPGRPLLLVVDDVQWCDPETLELLGFLIRRAPTAPVLVAATARSEELANTTLATFLSELLRDGSLHELALPRLDPAATGELAVRLGGGELDDDVIARLWQETEGNALFIVEALRSGLSGEGTTTPTVQAMIRSRLDHLSSDARHLVEIAGTLGRAFTVEELGAATGRDEDELVDALDELWRRQIIREQETGYDFSHDKLREVAHAEISPARRRRLHRAVAEGLAALHGTEPGPVSARLAAHYEAAGLVEQAVEAYRAVAARAVELFSLDEAIAALRHALRLLERLPAGAARDGREVAIRVALGAPTAAREGYNAPAARELYERAFALCRRLGGRVDPAVLRGLGLAELVAGRFDRSTSFGEALLEEGGDVIAVTEGHYLIGVSAFWTGDLGRSEEHLRAALAAYRAEHASEHMTRFAQDPKAVCLVRLAWTMLWRGDREDALALVADAKRHTLALEHPSSLAYVFLYSALIGVDVGDVDSAAADIEFCEGLWDRQALQYFMDLSRLLAAWVAHERGEPDAHVVMEEVLATWRREAQYIHLTYGLSLVARIRLERREFEPAREALREAFDRTAACNLRYVEPELLRLQGELQHLEGDAAAAEESLRRSLALAEEQGALWLRDRALESLKSLSSEGRETAKR